MNHDDVDLSLDDVLVLYDGFDDATPLINGESGIAELNPQLDDGTIRKRTSESLLRLNSAMLIEIGWFTHERNQLLRIDDLTVQKLLSAEDTWHPTSFLVEHVRYQLTERGRQALVSGMHHYRDQLPGYSPGIT